MRSIIFSPFGLSALIFAIGVAFGGPVKASSLTLADKADASVRQLQKIFADEALGTVNFAFDKDTLDGEARARLREQAQWIAAQPGIVFSVTGHTDKMGNDAYNMDLGMRRANRVVDHLVSLGIERQRLRAMVSYGELRPLEDIQAPERRNRRVTTQVILKKPSVPAILEIVTRRAVNFDSPKAEPVPENPPTPNVEPSPDPEPAPAPEPAPSPNGKKHDKPNSGRGNGDEISGDPGGSVGKNKGGDEVDVLP